MSKSTWLIPLVLILLACDDSTNDTIEGTWNLIEPPHPITLINRNYEPSPIYDVIFTISDHQVFNLDLAVNGDLVENETASLVGRDLTVEGGGMTLQIRGLKGKLSFLEASEVVYNYNNITKSIGPVQIGRY